MAVKDAEIVMVMGYPGAGKTTITGDSKYKKHVRLNRDTVGGSLNDLAPKLDAAIGQGETHFILDNTYGTVAQRAPIIAVGKKRKIPVRCIHLDTSIEDAQVNVCMRMIAKYGRILNPDEIAKESKNDPGAIPAAVLFVYRKEFKEPEMKEGFDAIETVHFERRINPSYTGEAYLFDFDGTLRQCKKPGQKYPAKPEDIEIIPGRKEKLQSLHKQKKRLLGISNMGDVGRGKISHADAQACYDHTIKLLGVPIDLSWCPHNPAPISCFCRKPMPGIVIAFIEKYKLDRDKTYLIGDMTSDRTCTVRAGIHFIHQEEFFK